MTKARRIYSLFVNTTPENSAYIRYYRNGRITVTANIDEAMDFTDFTIQELDWLEYMCWEMGYEEIHPLLFNLEKSDREKNGDTLLLFHRCLMEDFVYYIMDSECEQDEK